MRALTVVLIMAAFSAFSYTAPQQANVGQEKHNMRMKKDTVKNDSTEYELIIFDSRFETWYLTRNKPSWYHSESYYEHWNQRYVNEWNYRYHLGDMRFDSYIDYQRTKDYGLELEHKLYYFFEYFQEVNNISLK